MKEKDEAVEGEEEEGDENEIEVMIPLKFENDNKVYTHGDAAAEFHQIQKLLRRSKLLGHRE